MIGHFKGLTWADVNAMRLDEFRALCDAARADQKQSRSSSGRSGSSAPAGERRVPVMK